MNRANFQAANKPTPRTVEAVVADILGIPGEKTNDIQYDFKRNGSIIRVRKGGANHDVAFVYAKNHQHSGNAGGDRLYQLEQDAIIYSSDFTVVRYALKQGKNYVVNAHGTQIFVLKSDDLLNGEDDADWDAANDNAEELARIIEAAPGSIYALDEEATPATAFLEKPGLMLAAALTYAEGGWDVFPAPPGQKKSYKSAKYSNGAKWGKTRDPGQIRHDFQRWPEANIGIPTGKDNGFWVTEADTLKGHGVDGIASLRVLEEKHGELPPTLMAESPSGSLHHYFKWPEGIEIKNSTSKIAPGIDVRGEGGMVIAPPSVRGDGEYRWLNDNPIVDAPQWLLDLVTANSKGKEGKGKKLLLDGQKPVVVAEAFRHLDPRSLGEGITSAPIDAPIEQIRAAFAVIPNDNRGWDDWNKCGMALFHATEGSDDGLAVFHAWSSKSKKYDAQATADKWTAYKTCPPDRIGAGSIFHWANEAAPGWEQERRAKQIAENIKIGNDVTEPLLPQIMTLEEMRMRLVFVGSKGVVADSATGRIRKKEHAADEYAASQHPYALANGTLKKGPALKFWIASKDRMTVEVLAWVPGAGAICQPPEGPGPAFNMWRGLSPMAYPEDWQTRVEPFLEHVEFLVPIEQERERFLQWVTHIPRCPEVLPHTAYLMTTPVTGIGRNLLASILVRALRGFVAAGISLPEMLDGGLCRDNTTRPAVSEFSKIGEVQTNNQ
jgi:hypothetical protein